MQNSIQFDNSLNISFASFETLWHDLYLSSEPAVLDQPIPPNNTKKLDELIAEYCPDAFSPSSSSTLSTSSSKPKARKPNSALSPQALKLKRQKVISTIRLIVQQNEAARRCREKKQSSLIECQEELAKCEEKLRLMTCRLAQLEREKLEYKQREAFFKDTLLLSASNLHFFATPNN